MCEFICYNPIFFQLDGEPKDGEEMSISRVGTDLYERIFKPYTKKQWDKWPKVSFRTDPFTWSFCWLTPRLDCLHHPFAFRVKSEYKKFLPKIMSWKSLLGKPQATTNPKIRKKYNNSIYVKKAYKKGYPTFFTLLGGFDLKCIF